MKRSVWGVLIACSAFGLSMLGGCGKATSAPALGGETHWLEHCDGGAACGPGLECVCGVCTTACTEDASCSGDGAVCAEPAATTYADGCESSAPERLCVASSDVVLMTAAAPAPVISTEPDGTECRDGLFSTDVGCLSCSAVRNDLQLLRDQLQEQYGACSSDDDCVFAAAGSDCDEGCGAPVNRANVAAYNRDLGRLDRAYCQTPDWLAQCGTHAPNCSQTVPRCSSYFGTCYAGQAPAPCSDRPRTGCEADGECVLATGALYDARGQCFPAQAEPIRCVPRSFVCPDVPTPAVDSVGLCYFFGECIPEGFVAAPPEHPCNAVLGNICTN
jgi:hypothetical protein